MRNMHNIEIQPVAERIERLKAQIDAQLERMQEINRRKEYRIAKAEVELDALKLLFRRKHSLMREDGSRREYLDWLEKETTEGGNESALAEEMAQGAEIEP